MARDEETLLTGRAAAAGAAVESRSRVCTVEARHTVEEYCSKEAAAYRTIRVSSYRILLSVNRSPIKEGTGAVTIKTPLRVSSNIIQ